MDQENNRCRELISQSDLPKDQIDKFINLLNQSGQNQIHGNQISIIEYSTLKEKLSIINKFNKYKTFGKTFSRFEITAFKHMQNNLNYVVVIQLQKFNGIDTIRVRKMNESHSIQNQIIHIKQLFNTLFSSYLEFKEQFKSNELKNLCIHKIHSIEDGEFRISVIDKECLQQCSQLNNIKFIQVQLIQQLAETFNKEKRKQYSQDQSLNAIRELEQYWKINELTEQINKFEDNNNQSQLLYEEYVNSELIPGIIPSLQEFFTELKSKLVNQSSFIGRERINTQTQQFQQDEMNSFRHQIISNNYASFEIDMQKYNKHFLVYLLIIQKILLKDQTDEQRVRNLLECLQPYLRSKNYQEGIQKFCKSFDKSVNDLDQIIQKLDEL